MFQPQPPDAASTVSPGRWIAAFTGAAAAATVVALVLAFVARAVSVGTGQWLMVNGVRLPSAAIIGVAMAVPMMLAKVRGPAGPFAAALGALIAECVGWLVFAFLTGSDSRAITSQFPISMSENDLHTILNWASILLTPVVAGGLAAIFALRKPKRATLRKPKRATPPVPGWPPAPPKPYAPIGGRQDWPRRGTSGARSTRRRPSGRATAARSSHPGVAVLCRGCVGAAPSAIEYDSWSAVVRRSGHYW